MLYQIFLMDNTLINYTYLMLFYGYLSTKFNLNLDSNPLNFTLCEINHINTFKN